MLRKPKRSKNEVVASKGEEEKEYFSNVCRDDSRIIKF
jgi:hypothetical protein